MADDSTDRRVARVPNHFTGQRLDRFLVEHFPQYSRRRIADVIRAGEVRVDGQRARPGLVLKGGEQLELPVLSQAMTRLDRRTRKRERLRRDSAAPSEVAVLFRDDDLLVVAKPPGVPMHGGAGLGTTQTLIDILKPDVLEGFGLVHRLDRDTSGVVALVRGEELRAKTARLFQDDHAGLGKVYEAIVEGDPASESGSIDLPLTPPGRRGLARVNEDRGKPACTRYAVVERFEDIARLRLELVTGRTHQIRAHLAAIGHPLLVDPQYGRHGGWRRTDPRGQLDARLRRTPLHASELTLPHPRTDEVETYRAPMAADMKYALEVLRVRAGGRRKRGEDPTGRA